MQAGQRMPATLNACTQRQTTGKHIAFSPVCRMGRSIHAKMTTAGAHTTYIIHIT